jgi:hypothetical protein
MHCGARRCMQGIPTPEPACSRHAACIPGGLARVNPNLARVDARRSASLLQTPVTSPYILSAHTKVCGNKSWASVWLNLTRTKCAGGAPHKRYGGIITAGQCIGLIDDIPACEELVVRIVTECRERLTSARNYFG